MRFDLDGAGCLDKASFIYSQWAGYLERGTYASTEEWLRERGIAIRQNHTSGHASPKDLKRFAAARAPRALVPIHSFTWDEHLDSFENVQRLRDGEPFTIP